MIDVLQGTDTAKRRAIYLQDKHALIANTSRLRKGKRNSVPQLWRKANKYVRPRSTPIEMHAGHFACCFLVSHVELYADGTDRQTDAPTDAVTLRLSLNAVSVTIKGCRSRSRWRGTKRASVSADDHDADKIHIPLSRAVGCFLFVVGDEENPP